MVSIVVCNFQKINHKHLLPKHCLATTEQALTLGKAIALHSTRTFSTLMFFASYFYCPGLTNLGLLSKFSRRKKKKLYYNQGPMSGGNYTCNCIFTNVRYW